MRYEVQVVVGKRRTWLVDAGDAAEAKEKASQGEKEGMEKYVHSDDEIVVVAKPELAPLGPGDAAGVGLARIMPHAGESEEAARERVFGRGEDHPPETADTEGGHDDA